MLSLRTFNKKERDPAIPEDEPKACEELGGVQLLPPPRATGEMQ